MRSPLSIYPVDRYLVLSNINELVNITKEDLWNPEPALRPEDEITLRKLHEMLRSTADDLKLLSGELARYHEPGIQYKTAPTPLDEEFNEKVHIEEVVNAKFHGYKIIDSHKNLPSKIVQKDVVDGLMKTIAEKKVKHVVTTGVQVNQTPTKSNVKKNLVKSQTKIVQINNSKETQTKINIDVKNVKKDSSVAYKEFSYIYKTPKVTTQLKNLQLQELPSINIRSELKAQKVVHLDIVPESIVNVQNIDKSNVGVIDIKHDADPKPEAKFVNKFDEHIINPDRSVKFPVRKISKMETCESSDSNNDISESLRNMLSKQTKKTMHNTSNRNKMPTDTKISQKQGNNRTQPNLNEWRRKINAVYGRPTSRLKIKQDAKSKKIIPRQLEVSSPIPTNQLGLNNAEYIPYSKFTLGGVRVSDIEKEIANIPDKGDMSLRPILDKIINSRENSFHGDSPRKDSRNTKKILSTSDENLLQEVIDIQNKVSKTLSEEIGNKSLSADDNDTYADDFDDDKSNTSEESPQASDPMNSRSSKSESNKSNYNKNSASDKEKTDSKIHNQTYTKSLNLSFKNSVDVFEYIHSIETHDSATQSNVSHKLSLKETQTSPRDDTNLRSIHNDLWPSQSSIDPTHKVEKFFDLEKEFIKKIIIDEYADVIENTFNKPSTSGVRDIERNDNAAQKNTQTSPARVKSVMTSPLRTKTRTTSPLLLSLTVNQQTSPMVHKEEEIVVPKEDCDNLSISINLSSPRFSLRLPKTSRDVLSNMGSHSRSGRTRALPPPKERRRPSPSSSSVDGDYSSSDISSLGEIERTYKKMYRKLKLSSSEHSSSSHVSKESSGSGEVKPLRSGGEISVGQVRKGNMSKVSKSEGETSIGQVL